MYICIMYVYIYIDRYIQHYIHTYCLFLTLPGAGVLGFILYLGFSVLFTHSC